jgi:hypothetical protein
MVFSEDGKYMVSIGNAKECSVAVWSWPKGELLSSSYTLDRINQVRCSRYCFAPDRVLEFSTVGRDQVYFWALSTENVLEYYDVFLERNRDTKQLEEITSLDFVYLRRSAK